MCKNIFIVEKMNPSIKPHNSFKIAYLLYFIIIIIINHNHIASI